MISVQIRRATRDDLAGIVDLRLEQMTEWGEGTAGRDFSSRMEHWLFGQGDAKAHWVAIAGIEVVGILTLTDFERTPMPSDMGSHIGVLDNVFVHEEFRELGIGSRLVNKAMRYARAKNYAQLIVGVDERSYNLFDRAGFGGGESVMLLALEDHLEDF